MDKKGIDVINDFLVSYIAKLENKPVSEVLDMVDQYVLNLKKKNSKIESVIDFKSGIELLLEFDLIADCIMDYLSLEEYTQENNKKFCNMLTKFGEELQHKYGVNDKSHL